MQPTNFRFARIQARKLNRIGKWKEVCRDGEERPILVIRGQMIGMSLLSVNKQKYLEESIFAAAMEYDNTNEERLDKRTRRQRRNKKKDVSYAKRFYGISKYGMVWEFGEHIDLTDETDVARLLEYYSGWLRAVKTPTNHSAYVHFVKKHVSRKLHRRVMIQLLATKGHTIAKDFNKVLNEGYTQDDFNNRPLTAQTYELYAFGVMATIFCLMWMFYRVEIKPQVNQLLDNVKKVTETVETTAQRVTTVLEDQIGPAAEQTGKTFGFVSDITDGIKKVWDWAKEKLTELVDAFKATSPLMKGFITGLLSVVVCIMAIEYARFFFPSELKSIRTYLMTQFNFGSDELKAQMGNGEDDEDLEEEHRWKNPLYYVMEMLRIGFAKVTKKKFWDVVDAVPKITRLAQSLEWIFEHMKDLINWLIEMWTGEYRGRNKLEREILAFGENVDKYTTLVSSTVAEEVFSVETRTLDLQLAQEKKRLEFGIQRKKEMRNYFAVLFARKCEALLKHQIILKRKTHCAAKRPEPVWFNIFGLPKAGKSYSAEQIFIDTARYLKNYAPDIFDHDFDFSQLYVMNQMDEYHDNYNCELFCFIDDMFASTDNDKRRVFAASMLTLVSSAPFPLLAADPDKKGKMYFKSRAILSTTNVMGNDFSGENLGLADVRAFSSRITISAELKDGKYYLDPDYVSSFGDVLTHQQVVQIFGEAIIAKERSKQVEKVPEDIPRFNGYYSGGRLVLDSPMLSDDKDKGKDKLVAQMKSGDSDEEPEDDFEEDWDLEEQCYHLDCIGDYQRRRDFNFWAHARGIGDNHRLWPESGYVSWILWEYHHDIRVTRSARVYQTGMDHHDQDWAQKEADVLAWFDYVISIWEDFRKIAWTKSFENYYRFRQAKDKWMRSAIHDHLTREGDENFYAQMRRSDNGASSSRPRDEEEMPIQWNESIARPRRPIGPARRLSGELTREARVYGAQAIIDHAGEESVDAFGAEGIDREYLDEAVAVDPAVRIRAQRREVLRAAFDTFPVETALSKYDATIIPRLIAPEVLAASIKVNKDKGIYMALATGLLWLKREEYEDIEQKWCESTVADNKVTDYVFLYWMQKMALRGPYWQKYVNAVNENYTGLTLVQSKAIVKSSGEKYSCLGYLLTFIGHFALGYVAVKLLLRAIMPAPAHYDTKAQAAYDIGAGKERGTRNVKREKDSKGTRRRIEQVFHPVAQGGEDFVQHSYAAIAQNSDILEVRIAPEGMSTEAVKALKPVSQCWVLFVFENYALVPLHLLFANYGVEGERYLSLAQHQDWILKVRDLDVCVPVRSDVGLVHFPEMGMKPNILKWFADAMPSWGKYEHVMGLPKKAGSVYVHTALGWDAKTKKTLVEQEEGVEPYDFETSLLFYGVPNKPGFCGSVYCHKKSGKIVGMHMGGVEATDTTSAVSLFKSDLLPFEAKYCKYNIGAPMRVEFLEAQCMRGLTVLGKVPRHFATWLPTETSLRESILDYRSFPIPETNDMPAMLKPHGDISPLGNAFAKFEKVRMSHKLPPPPKNLMDFLPKSFDPSEVKRINIWEAVHGNGRLKQMKMSTSPGYFYKKLGFNTRRELFFDKKGDPMIHPLVERRVNDYYRRMDAGETIPCMYEAYLKDEIRDAERVKAGKTRLYYSGDLDTLIVSRMELGMFIEEAMKDPSGSPIALGINVHSRDWERLYSRMKGLEEEMRSLGAGDFESFDITIKLYFAFLFIRMAGYHHERPDYVGKIVVGMVVGWIVCGCLVFQFIGTHSGHLITGIFNSFSNWCGHKVCFCSLHPEDDWVVVETAFVGDDSLFTVPAKYGDFNMAYIQQYFKRHFGMTYTSPHKTGEMSVTWENVTFLKRRFVPGPLGVMAPLKETSIANSIKWCNKDATLDDLGMTCRSALNDAYHHGERLYRRIWEWTRKEQRRLGVKWDLPEWESMREQRRADYAL